MTGRGAGLDEDGLIRKCRAIKKGIEINNPNPDDPLDVLSKAGGYEIGAIAGSILAAAFCNKPVVINVSEFLQLIEITVFLMEHVSCNPDGIMEWWNIGMLV